MGKYAEDQVVKAEFGMQRKRVLYLSNAVLISNRFVRFEMDMGAWEIKRKFIMYLVIK